MTPTGTRPGPVKCVVWDLDRTLLQGVLLERPAAEPRAADGMPEVLAELHRRGILNSLASRNPPETAADAVGRVRWPCPFVAPQYGWGDKSDSLRRIAAALNIGADALAFVDDDPYERAEVSFRLPQVLVLSPADVADALDWPAFTPAVVTAEGRRRAEAYAEARRRTDAARSFAGTREGFLRSCRTVVRLWPAGDADVPRLHELSVRTSQFNSAAGSRTEVELRSGIGSDRHVVTCVGLSDRFGDDGLVGGVVTATGDVGWDVEILMMSCRAMGRGVIETLLSCLLRTAAGHGAGQLRVPLRVNERNVPLRIALVAAGFRADGHAGPDAVTLPVFRRALDGPLPEPPDWITVEDAR